MDITLRHAITYTTRGDVPVSVVAKALIANERLIHEGLRVLEASEPGLVISRVRVKVYELSNASPLKAVLAASIIAAYQDELVKEVPALIEKLTGVHVPDNSQTIVTVLVLVIALYVIASVAERTMKLKKLDKVKKEYEDKKERLSELTGISKENLERYIEQTIPKERQDSLSSKAVDFFLPAKLEPGTEMLGINGLRVDAGVIAEIPESLVDAVDGKVSYDVPGVVVDIHRSDRDQNKYGWRAIVESISDRKVRMELDPSIDPDQLYGEKTIIGDVSVLEEKLESGEIEVKAYLLTKVYPKKAS